ncbi:hypothetical protein D3C86_1927920 [compost metagenome]
MASAARAPPSIFSLSSLDSPVAWKKLTVPSLAPLMKPLRKCSGVSRSTGPSPLKSRIWANWRLPSFATSNHWEMTPLSLPTSREEAPESSSTLVTLALGALISMTSRREMSLRLWMS